MEIKEERLQQELQQASISLVLDTYDDIFSDFDPRPYSERALSDDFLLECKRAARDKEEGLELDFNMPKKLRNLTEENIIRKRLKDHFKKHHIEKDKERIKIRRGGIMWTGLGALLILGIVFGSVKIENLWLTSVFTILEVPGWFFVWEGLRKILIDAKEKQPDAVFYHKMASAQIIFRSY